MKFYSGFPFLETKHLWGRKSEKQSVWGMRVILCFHHDAGIEQSSTKIYLMTLEKPLENFFFLIWNIIWLYGMQHCQFLIEVQPVWIQSFLFPQLISLRLENPGCPAHYSKLFKKIHVFSKGIKHKAKCPQLHQWFEIIYKSNQNQNHTIIISLK